MFRVHYRHSLSFKFNLEVDVARRQLYQQIPEDIRYFDLVHGIVAAAQATFLLHVIFCRD